MKKWGKVGRRKREERRREGIGREGEEEEEAMINDC